MHARLSKLASRHSLAWTDSRGFATAAGDRDLSPRDAVGGATPSKAPRPARIAPVALIAAAVVIVAGGVMLWMVRHQTTPDKPRNVLLITMDTTRADYLGCYGRQSAGTPNLDRLANEGVRFTHATTCAPVTLPSHCSMIGVSVMFS